MSRYLVREMAPLWGVADDDGASSAARGRALEDLAAYLFNKVPGVTVVASNSVDVFGSQELDVVLQNDGVQTGLVSFESELLIECKNWANPVGSLEVAWFDTKLRCRGLRHGFLIALNGVTGDAYSLTSAHQIISMALSEGRRIVVLRREDIEGLRTSEALVSLCRERMTQTLLSRGIT